MASTLKYTDILNMIQRQLPRVAEDIHAETIVNSGLNMIWMAYNWRESLKEITPFYLIPGRQDYPSDIITIPTDIHGLQQVFLVFLGGDNAVKYPVKVIKQIQKTALFRPPRSITYMTTMSGNKSGYRVEPRPPQSYGAPFYLIEGTYKRRTPVITAQTLNTTIAFDDMYQGVLFDACLYQAKRLAGSQDAGNYYQFAQMSIYNMAASEGLADGESNIAPDSPIVGSVWDNVMFPLSSTWQMV